MRWSERHSGAAQMVTVSLSLHSFHACFSFLAHGAGVPCIPATLPSCCTLPNTFSVLPFFSDLLLLLPMIAAAPNCRIARLHHSSATPTCSHYTCEYDGWC